MRAALRAAFKETKSAPPVELVTALMEMRALSAVQIEELLRSDDVSVAAAVLRSAAKLEDHPNLGIERLVQVADTSRDAQLRLGALVGIARCLALRDDRFGEEWALEAVLRLGSKVEESDRFRSIAFDIVGLNLGASALSGPSGGWRDRVRDSVIGALSPKRMGAKPGLERACTGVLLGLLDAQWGGALAIEPRRVLRLFEERLALAGSADAYGEALLALALAHGQRAVAQPGWNQPAVDAFAGRLVATLDSCDVSEGAWATLALAHLVRGLGDQGIPQEKWTPWAARVKAQARKACVAGWCSRYLPCQRAFEVIEPGAMTAWVSAAESAPERGLRQFSVADACGSFHLDQDGSDFQDGPPDPGFWRRAAPVHGAFISRSDQWRPVCGVLKFARSEGWPEEDQLPLVDALGMTSHDEGVERLLAVLEVEEPTSLLFRRAALSLGRIFEVYRAVSIGHPLRAELYPPPGP